MPAKTLIKKRTQQRGKKAPESSGAGTGNSWREEDKESRDTLEFIQAIDRHKRKTQKAFPTWSEILQVLKSLGYRKIIP